MNYSGRMKQNEKQEKKDIFISYKNDGSGERFAARLFRDLTEQGYSVFWDTDAIHAESFPDALRQAIEECRDFILVLSHGCLDQLKINRPVDWIREEILTARKYNKHIIPILLENVSMPQNPAEMPECLRFLPTITAISFPKQYKISAFSELLAAADSKPDSKDLYRDAYNSNPDYDITNDFLEIRKHAEKGDIEAMYEFGMMCFYGAASATNGKAEWDYTLAAEWLKKVSESESDLKYHADSILGRMYYQGLIPREPQSYEQAYAYHARAAEKDGYSAAEKLFLMRIGAGCRFDFKAVLDYYQHAGATDDEAKRELASFLSVYGKYHEALEVYESMEYLSPESEYQLGLLYLRGVNSDPPQPDCIQAAYHLRNAADNHHTSAAYEYASMCLRPTGKFRKNFAEAEKYFRQAADGGIPAAQYMLGYLYRTGLSGHKSLPDAVRYFEIAKAQNFTQAALELASIYQQPECSSYGKAFACAQLAASHGLAEGELILGNLLFWGRGCEVDVDRAYEMYLKAKEHGLYYAEVMLQKIDRIKKH